jgi:dipeptide transport system permease protein
MVTAIFSRDYPVVQGGMLMVAAVFVLVNLVTDAAYAVVNPRLRA